MVLTIMLLTLLLLLNIYGDVCRSLWLPERHEMTLRYEYT